jgi:hypothetical protein
LLLRYPLFHYLPFSYHAIAHVYVLVHISMYSVCTYASVHELVMWYKTAAFIHKKH